MAFFIASVVCLMQTMLASGFDTCIIVWIGDRVEDEHGQCTERIRRPLEVISRF